MNDLCLVMIARDESRCIERALRSAQPLVDRMVVLDTGSTDNTVEIARTCGAEVHHFDWIDDFAAARNRSLELANASWALILDADEWLETSSATELQRVRHVIHQHMATMHQSAGLLRLRNEIHTKGPSGLQQEFADTWLPRLLPGHTRYCGQIHEQPQTVAPDQRLQVTVRHDGYIQGDLQHKRARNQALIALALARDPDNAYLHFQAGVEAEIAEDWPRACLHFERSHLLARGRERPQPYAHGLAYRLIHALSRACRHEDALLRGLELTTQWPDSSDIQFAYGNACLDAAIADPASAREVWLPAARAAWERCLEIGEHDRYDGHVRGRGSYLAAHNLAVTNPRFHTRPC